MAIALAEEERDTCPSCGHPKAWCRDPKAQFGAFEAHEEMCHATYALLSHQKDVGDKRSPEAWKATQMSIRFSGRYVPDVEAGLELGPDGSGTDEDAEDR